MADERKRETGLMAAWHAAMIIARLPLTGEALDPNAINPYGTGKPAPESKAMQDLKRWQAKRTWRTMCTPPGKRA